MFSFSGFLFVLVNGIIIQSEIMILYMIKKTTIFVEVGEIMWLPFLLGHSPESWARKQTIFDFPSYHINYMYPPDEKFTKRMSDLIEKIELYDGKYITFDVETTGLDAAKHQIIQISAVFFDNGIPVKGFQTYVKPNNPIPPRITDLTGITDHMVRKAPGEKFACQSFMEFCGEYITHGGLTTGNF